MKSQTLILFILALGLAQCVSPSIEWVGDWEFKSSTLPEECIPESIVTSSLGPLVVFKLIWASTPGCKKSDIDGWKVVRVKFPTSNTLDITDVVVPFEFTLNGNSALTKTGNDAESTFEKKVSTPSVDWAGTWNIQTKSSSEECFPKDKITVLTTSSTMTLSWVWDLTEACSKNGLAGTFYETTVAKTNGDIIDFFFPYGDELGKGTFTVSGDAATFKGLNELSCHFERETPQQVNWVGTWDLKIISSATSCLPSDKVIVTSSDSSVTYSWNWDSNEICKQAGLSRKSFTKTLSTPTGNSVTLQDGEVSVTLSLNGDTIIFVSQSGGSGTFARQIDILSSSWAGNWIFKSTTQPDECIPKKIDTSVSGSQVIFEWTWDSTQGCKDHFVDGEKYTKIKLPIQNEIIVEPSSAKVPFKFILDGNTAKAETGVDAESTFERKAVTPSVDWAGTWVIKSREAGECYPKDKIMVSTKGSFMVLSWVWDLTEPCSKYGLAGKAHESIVAIDNGDVAKLSFVLGTIIGSGRFSVNGNSAIFKSVYKGYECNLVREEPPEPEVNWDGTWVLKSTSSPTSCYPKEQAVISKLGSSLTFSWIWDSTESCKKVGLDGKPFAKTIQTPTGNSATLHYLVGDTEVVGTFSIEEDLATFKRENDDSCSFDRQLEPLTVEWAGTWNLKTTSSANACYPKEKITIATKNTIAAYSWVWDTNENCEKVGLSGKDFKKEVEIPKSNSVILTYEVQGAEAVVILNVNRDVAQFSATQNDASCTFARHIPITNWVGTWILKTTSTASCYPKEQIYVSSSEDSVTYSWVWDSNDNCKQFELSGKPFTKTVPTPKGNSVTLNFIVEGSETSVIFTVDEDKATFKGLKEASCTFDRQTEKPVVNWAGTWIIKTTSPAEACYPKEKATISNASNSITYNWVWDSSESCSKIGLSGKAFEKTTPVPNGNLVPLHFQTKEAEVYGILVINGDKASFNNLDGASCTFEREIEKKGGSFIIWLIIALVLVGGVGFFFYKKRQQEELAKNLADNSSSKSFLPA